MTAGITVAVPQHPVFSPDHTPGGACYKAREYRAEHECQNDKVDTDERSIIKWVCKSQETASDPGFPLFLLKESILRPAVLGHIFTMIRVHNGAVTFKILKVIALYLPGIYPDLAALS